MKVLIINSVCGIKSTGRIAAELADEFAKEGHTVRIAYGREEVPEKYREYAVQIGSDGDVRLNALKSRILDNDGFCAKKATKEFLQWADTFDPDLIWLHNLHGYYINIQQLFSWIKSRPSMEVRWTLHDCWAFTGHCSYFTYAKCDKWTIHCENCPQKKEYPTSYVLDRSRSNYDRKREIFTGVKNMKLITPSQWLADLVKISFLKEYETEVRHNTINTAVFRPVKSDIKEKIGVRDRKMILGVAAQWQPSKGFPDFLKLNEILPDQYAIVLVGLTEEQLRDLPRGIIGITRTNNAEELAELYSAADVFVNPTYEDNYPTVNLEAIACGTHVITYDAGGSPESAAEDGTIVETGNIEELANQIRRICDGKVK